MQDFLDAANALDPESPWWSHTSVRAAAGRGPAWGGRRTGGSRSTRGDARKVLGLKYRSVGETGA